MSSQEREGIPQLCKENHELRCANEMLKSARVSLSLLMLGRVRQAASSKKKDLAGRSRLRWVEVSARRAGSVKLRGISSDRSRGSCGRPLPSLS